MEDFLPGDPPADDALGLLDRGLNLLRENIPAAIPDAYHQSELDAIVLQQINYLRRKNEDYRMYLKFWPSSIAKCFAYFYSTSEKSNSD